MTSVANFWWIWWSKTKRFFFFLLESAKEFFSCTHHNYTDTVDDAREIQAGQQTEVVQYDEKEFFVLYHRQTNL